MSSRRTVSLFIPNQFSLISSHSLFTYLGLKHNWLVHSALAVVHDILSSATEKNAVEATDRNMRGLSLNSEVKAHVQIISYFFVT